MPVTTAPPEQRLLLRNISWETYKRLLTESVDACGPPFTYDGGNLEIMVVSVGHEKPNRTLASLVEITAKETGKDFSPAGSTTFKRKDLAKGFEPDSCFYFQYAALVRDKQEIDLAADPPPKLIIKVDISSSSLNRFPIYAAVGVREIWRHDGERVRFHILNGESYLQIEERVALQPMTASQATIFLDLARTEAAPAWLRTVREWIQFAGLSHSRGV